MSRRSSALAGAALAVVLAACAKKEEAPAPKASVVLAKVALGSVEETLELSGRLVPPPTEDASLAPQIAGRVVSVTAREGERVAKGQLLATIDAAPFDEAERAAAAALAKARGETLVKRRAADLTARLFEKGIASAEERDNDRAAAEAAHASEVDAEAHLGEARRRREWTRVSAPFDGVVAQVTRHAGETVDGTPATPVLRLLGTSSLEVAAEASAADLARLKPGLAARVAGPGGERDAEVVRVAAAVDAANGLGEVRARVRGAAPAPLLASVTLRVILARKEGVVVVPPSALRRAEDGTDEVVRVAGGAAHPAKVTLGVRTANAVEVTSGLAVGDEIVVDSPLGLAEGQPVEPRPRS